MKLLVKTIRKGDYWMEVTPQHTVGDLKRDISNRIPGCLVEDQKLLYQAHVMKDADLLSSYDNLDDGTKVFLVLAEEDITRNPNIRMKIPNIIQHSPLTSIQELPGSSSSSPTGTATFDQPPGSSGAGANASPSAPYQQHQLPQFTPQQIELERLLRSKIPGPSQFVDSVIANIFKGIDKDISNCSLDDLERLADLRLSQSSEDSEE